MRLVEFLIRLLEAQAQAMQRLAALFSEEYLIEMLECAGEKQDSSLFPKVNYDAFSPSTQESEHQYRELEGAVHELKLPATLEFHLWAYPTYRAFIESSLELGAKIKGPGGDAGLELTDEVIRAAKSWLKGLPIPSEFLSQAEHAIEIPWLRFRSDVLKKIGRRPLGPVY